MAPAWKVLTGKVCVVWLTPLNDQATWYWVAAGLPVFGSLCKANWMTGRGLTVAELYTRAGLPPTSVPGDWLKSRGWLMRTAPWFKSTVASPSVIREARSGSEIRPPVTEAGVGRLPPRPVAPSEFSTVQALLTRTLLVMVTLWPPVSLRLAVRV